MAVIKAKDLIGSKVVTQSGQLIGRVTDFEIEAAGQNIVKYHSQEDLLGFFKEPLLISSHQVIEIKKDRIIVEDGLVAEKATIKKTAPDMGYVK